MSERLLYLHAKPHADESCFSWLLRTAELHALTAAELLRAFNVIKRRDLDLAIGPQILAKFARGLDCSFDTLRQMSKFFEAFRSEKWLRVWIKESGSGMPLLGYCPHCLDEDEHPYWRSTWRLKYWMVCPKHCSSILNVCMACERTLGAFDYHGRRSSQHGISLCTRCPHCMTELRHAVSGTYRYPRHQIRDLMDLQNVVTAALVRGGFRVVGIDRLIPLALLPSILLAGGTRAGSASVPLNGMLKIQIMEAIRSLRRGGEPGFFIDSRSEFVSVKQGKRMGPAQQLAEAALLARFSTFSYLASDQRMR